MYELVGKARLTFEYRLIELKNKLQRQKQILRKKKQKQLEKNVDQQGTKINEAPCAGSTMSICYILNLFGYDTGNGSTNGDGGSTNGNGGSTNGNGGSTNGNGDSTNENGWNGSLKIGEESLEPTTTTATEATEYTPTYVSSQNSSFYFFEYIF